MCSLLTLHVELIDQIFHYCGTSDLKNVSLCSRATYLLAKKKLWQSVKISWKSVTHINWRNSSTLRQVENLKYTRCITFHNEVERYAPPHFLGKHGWDPFYAKKYTKNFERLLSYCNGDTVRELSINKGGDIFTYACESFPKLQKLHLEKMLVFSSGNGCSEQFTKISHLSNIIELNLDSRITGVPVEYQQILFASGTLQQLKVLVLPALCCQATLPSLQQLKLTGSINQKIDIDCVASVASSLRNLDLSNTRVNTEELQKLPRLHKLEFLSIGSCFETHDFYMESISTMQSLKFLDIEGSSNDRGLFHLQNLTKLKGLVMSSYVVANTDVVALYLMKMSSLVYLDITSWGGQQAYNSDLLSVAAVKKLQCHPSLKRLATYYKIKTFGGSCGRMSFVKSQHACYDVWRSVDEEPDKVESRFLDPDGWRIQALEKLIE